MRWHGTELLNLGSDCMDLIPALPPPSGGWGGVVPREAPHIPVPSCPLTSLMEINGCYGERLPRGKKYSINVSDCYYETFSTSQGGVRRGIIHTKAQETSLSSCSTSRCQGDRIIYVFPKIPEAEGESRAGPRPHPPCGQAEEGP